MTRMEFDERMNALNVELRQALQPFNDRVNALMAEKANVGKKIAELEAESKRLSTECAMYLLQRDKTITMYEERKLALRQQLNANYVPKTKHPVDGKMMHHVRRCVLGCLRDALEGLCDPEDIHFNFHIEENGDMQLECEIPDIKSK